MYFIIILNKDNMKTNLEYVDNTLDNIKKKNYT